MSHTSETKTHGIRILVESSFLPSQSDASNEQFFFAYHVQILNESAEPAQLTDRYWRITNALGRVQEVRGKGVVGQTPNIAPGEAFEYTSFCPLDTEFGTMEGNYKMVRKDGSVFEAQVETFVLATPHAIN